MELEDLSKIIPCGLCLNTIYTHSEIIEEVVRQALDIVLPNLNLEKGNKHRICKLCYSKLFGAFNFKASCMDTEDAIFPYVSTDKASTIELKEVFLKMNGNIELTDTWKQQRICRLCLQLTTYGFVSLNEVDNDIIDTYIPQVKIDATENPVICASCLNSLCTHGSFLINCLKRHNKFKSADKQPDIKCEIELEDGPELQMIYKNIEEQFNIKSEEIKINTGKEDQDNDTSLDKLGEKIIDNKRNHISEDIGEINCRYGFTSETKDQLNKNSSENQMYMCNNLENKEKLTHKGLPKQKSQQLVHKNPSKIKMYKCDVCHYKTDRKPNLKIHQVIHKDPSEIEMYRCDECDYVSKRKYWLKNHQLVHKNSSEVQMYRCDACNFETKHKYVLKGHQLVHKNPSKIRMYKCDVCHYQTNRRPNLKIHQVIHKDPSEIEMYKCDECDYVSKRKYLLKNHQLVHKNSSEIQMYRCDACDYETKYKYSLKSHQLLHKNPAEIKMYKCEFCSYKSKRKNNLRSHLLKHKNPSEILMYRCDTCDYKTRYESDLKKHQLWHKDPSAIPIYKCDFCFYETKYKTSLKTHLFKHKDPSETKMQKCTICPFESHYQRCLKRHILLHKGNSEIQT